jgi:ribosomal protein S18 acetylase RimI-like enzyme
VGHLLATQVGDEGEVLTIAVREDARRRGLARAMLTALADRWRAHGAHTGWLEVRADNEGARALYASLGWTSAGRRRGYYDDGTDAIVMRWAP